MDTRTQANDKNLARSGANNPSGSLPSVYDSLGSAGLCIEDDEEAHRARITELAHEDLPVYLSRACEQIPIGEALHIASGALFFGVSDLGGFLSGIAQDNMGSGADKDSSCGVLQLSPLEVHAESQARFLRRASPFKGVATQTLRMGCAGVSVYELIEDPANNGPLVTAEEDLAQAMTWKSTLHLIAGYVRAIDYLAELLMGEAYDPEAYRTASEALSVEGLRPFYESTGRNELIELRYWLSVLGLWVSDRTDTKQDVLNNSVLGPFATTIISKVDEGDQATLDFFDQQAIDAGTYLRLMLELHQNTSQLFDEVLERSLGATRI